MSETLRPEQREQEIDQQRQTDRQSNGVQRAHDGSRGASHSAISPSESAKSTITSPSQKRSTVRLLSPARLDGTIPQGACKEGRRAHQDGVKGGFTRRGSAASSCACGCARARTLPCACAHAKYAERVVPSPEPRLRAGAAIGRAVRRNIGEETPESRRAA